MPYAWNLRQKTVYAWKRFYKRSLPKMKMEDERLMR